MAGLLIWLGWFALGVAIGLAILWRRLQRTDVQSPPRPFSLEHERHCEEHARKMGGSMVITPPGWRVSGAASDRHSEHRFGDHDDEHRFADDDESEGDDEGWSPENIVSVEKKQRITRFGDVMDYTEVQVRWPRS